MFGNYRSNKSKNWTQGRNDILFGHTSYCHIIGFTKITFAVLKVFFSPTISTQPEFILGIYLIKDIFRWFTNQRDSISWFRLSNPIVTKSQYRERDIARQHRKQERDNIVTQHPYREERWNLRKKISENIKRVHGKDIEAHVWRKQNE